ncbi:MAG TPA: hypothetical protein VMD74_04470 [Candidatus Methylomirabilis sp.]|nr:hypothetical protein [Candidatus Methylomirabilis sp.]
MFAWLKKMFGSKKTEETEMKEPAAPTAEENSSSMTGTEEMGDKMEDEMKSEEMK